MTTLNVLISAAGRRPYLVEWFTQALSRLPVSGNVVVADSDPSAASQAFANSFVTAPRLTAPDYKQWFTSTVETHDISLAISLNDHELSLWARDDFDALTSATTIHLSRQMQELVEDKLAMAQYLTSADVLTPPTLTGAEVYARPEAVKDWGDDVIIKHRYGSGSVGLTRCSRAELQPALLSSAQLVLDRFGEAVTEQSAALDALIVQPLLDGVEYGIDMVSDFEGCHAATLARRKVAMRAGETDKATSVDASEFDSLGRSVSTVVPHRGLMDGDVIVTHDDRAWVIDLNPRFGGGYPFSHIAGADVPSAYVAWALGSDADHEWFDYREGVTGAKYVGVAETGARE